MKEEILKQLKTKYSNLGLSVKTLEGFAEQLATTVTEESQIEGAVNGAEFYLKIAQAEADRVRQDAKKNQNIQQQQTTETQKTNDVEKPEWQKAIEALTNQVTALTQKNVTSTRRELYEKTLGDLPVYLKQSKLKDFEKMNFPNDDDFNSFLTEVQSDVTAINQELINSGLATKVMTGSSGKKVEQAQVLDDIKTWAEQKK